MKWTSTWRAIFSSTSSEYSNHTYYSKNIFYQHCLSSVPQQVVSSPCLLVRRDSDVSHRRHAVRLDIFVSWSLLIIVLDISEYYCCEVLLRLASSMKEMTLLVDISTWGSRFGISGLGTGTTTCVLVMGGAVSLDTMLHWTFAEERTIIRCYIVL